MEGTKTAWRSLTVLSAGVSALVALLGAAGVAVDADTVGQAVEAAAQLASAVMAAVAVYGRLRATTRIGRRR